MLAQPHRVGGGGSYPTWLVPDLSTFPEGPLCSHASQPPHSTYHRQCSDVHAHMLLLVSVLTLNGVKWQQITSCQFGQVWPRSTLQNFWLLIMGNEGLGGHKECHCLTESDSGVSHGRCFFYNLPSAVPPGLLRYPGLWAIQPSSMESCPTCLHHGKVP